MLPDPFTLPLLIPLVAGVLCLVVPDRWEALRGWLTIAAAAVSAAAAWMLFSAGNQQSEYGGWLFLRVDELSGFILLAACGFAVLIALYSLDYMRGKASQRLYWACLSWSLAASGGVLLAAELLLLLSCWGVLALTLYLMIGRAGPDARVAARKTLIIVGGSDALLVLGTALLWVVHGSTRMDQGALSLDSTAARLAFLSFAAAAFAKAGVIPLHTWLPDCGQHADAPVTAFLPASLDKLLGVYLLVRVVRDLFEMTAGINSLLMLVGAVTIVGGAMMALVQQNLKRLLAYCAVGQVGYILLAIGTGTSLGLAAGLFHMLNHAIYKACLFLGAGVVQQKTGTVDLDRLGGLATRLPVTFGACLVASLSVSGIPPFNGFASKWMVYQAVIAAGADSGSMLWVVWLSAAMVGSALTLALFVKMLHGVFLCKPSPEVRATRLRKAAWPAAVPMVVLAGLCVVFGVFAHSIPLPLFIFPASGAAEPLPGTWLAGQATGLILLAIIVGWAIYAVALRHAKLRKCPTYVGGEDMARVQIPGVVEGEERNIEVTGADFYRTVEQLPFVKTAYAMARNKVFDIFEITGRASGPLVRVLRGVHNGLLPLYFTWFILGLLAILIVLNEGAP